LCHLDRGFLYLSWYFFFVFSFLSFLYLAQSPFQQQGKRLKFSS